MHDFAVKFRTDSKLVKVRRIFFEVNDIIILKSIFFLVRVFIETICKI